MSGRTQSARASARAVGAQGTLCRPRTGNPPKVPHFTCGVTRELRPKDMSQESFIEQLRQRLDKDISLADSRKEVFLLHQNVFMQIIQRFDLDNKAFSKVKQGYEDIMKDLRGVQKQREVQMSMRSLSESMQTQILMMQEKIRMKRNSLNELIGNLNKLISDIREENQEHTKNIDLTKENLLKVEKKNLDTDALYVELTAKYEKKLQSYKNKVSNQQNVSEKEIVIENQISENHQNIEDLISQLVSYNSEFDSLKKEVQRFEEIKRQLVVSTQQTSGDLAQKMKDTAKLQQEIDSLSVKMKTIQQNETSLHFDLSKIAHQLHLPNRTIQNLSTSPILLLESCITKVISSSTP